MSAWKVTEILDERDPDSPKVSSIYDDYDFDRYFAKCPNCLKHYHKYKVHTPSLDWIQIDENNEDSDHEGIIHFCCMSCKEEYIEDLEGTGIEVL